MQQAIDETNRRRAKQIAFNEANGIDPTPLRKKIADITDLISKESEDTEEISKAFNTLKKGTSQTSRANQIAIGVHNKSLLSLPRQELIALIESLSEQMRSAAAELNFELAARLRDEIRELKRELRVMTEAGT